MIYRLDNAWRLSLLAATLVSAMQIFPTAAAAESSGAPPKPAAVVRRPRAEAAPAPQASDYAAINSLWQKFLNALREGRIQAAYNCYARSSRACMNLKDFAAQHHPATAYCEMLLSGTEESRLDVMENKAVLSYVPYQRTSAGAVAEIKIFMVREDSGWRLVTPSRWRQTAIEADARTLLQRLHARLAQFMKKSDSPVTLAAFAKANPEFMASPLYQDVGRIYYFEADLPADKPWSIHARPRRAKTGLRNFAIDAGGKITVLPPITGASATK